MALIFGQNFLCHLFGLLFIVSTRYLMVLLFELVGWTEVLGLSLLNL